MANLVFNIGAGRVAEAVHRILGTGGGAQEANAALIVVLLAASGIETDAVLRDKDTLSDLVSGTTNEATNTGYARKTLDETGDGVAVTVDDSNDRVDCDFSDLTWTAVANDGTGAVSDLVVCIDWTTAGGDDTNIVPLTLHDFSVTPDGSDITAQVAAAGFFRATPA